MAEDIMPNDPIGAAKWKLAAQAEWLAKTFQRRQLGGLPEVIEDELTQLEDKNTMLSRWVNDPARLSTGRYLILCLVLYSSDENEAPEIDKCDWYVVDTLEQAKTEVKAHIFADTVRADYTHACRVFASNLRKELFFEEVQHIKWKL
jgi:hypothetical protein